MPISDKHLTAAHTILTFLTWKRLCKLAALILSLSLLVLLWIVHRSETISYSPTTKVSLLYINPNLKNDIQNIVDKNDNIIGIQIITINFQKNIRVSTFSSIDNPKVEEIFNKLHNNQVIEFPLFNESTKNNTRILNLINGEFICVPFTDHIAYTYAPEAGKYIGHICSIGIPPSYGNFSGIVTIYLRSAPSRDDNEQMFSLARNISLRIFNDNFEIKNRK